MHMIAYEIVAETTQKVLGGTINQYSPRHSLRSCLLFQSSIISITQITV